MNFNMNCNYSVSKETNNKLDNVLKSITKNQLNETFFSDANSNIIQNAIRYEIWKKTKYTIGNQSTTQLNIIMRSIYLQYSENLPYQITNQVKRLNNLVITHSVPNIITNVKQHINYKKALDTMPVVMEHPKNVSSAGSKTLINNVY